MAYEPKQSAQHVEETPVVNTETRMSVWVNFLPGAPILMMVKSSQTPSLAVH